VPGVPFTFYEPERPPLLRHLSPQYVTFTFTLNPFGGGGGGGGGGVI